MDKYKKRSGSEFILVGKDRMDQRTDIAAISHESLGSTRNLAITPVPVYLIIKVADIEIYDWWNNSRVKDESKVAWQTEKLVNADPTGRDRIGELWQGKLRFLRVKCATFEISVRKHQRVISIIIRIEEYFISTIEWFQEEYILMVLFLWRSKEYAKIKYTF